MARCGLLWRAEHIFLGQIFFSVDVRWNSHEISWGRLKYDKADSDTKISKKGDDVRLIRKIPNLQMACFFEKNFHFYFSPSTTLKALVKCTYNVNMTLYHVIHLETKTITRHFEHTFMFCVELCNLANDPMIVTDTDVSRHAYVLPNNFCRLYRSGFSH